MRVFLVTLGLIGVVRANTEAPIGITGTTGSSSDECIVTAPIDITTKKTIPLEGYEPMTFNMMCRNVPGSFGSDAGSLEWTVDTATADPVPSLTGGVLDGMYELSKLIVHAAGSPHSLDGESQGGELEMVFINSTFSGNLEAAMEVPYGVATLSLLMNTTGTGGEWFEPFMNVTTPATQSLTMADILDTLTDSVSSAFDYYMYTGSTACDASSGVAIKQFYFVAEDMLEVNSTQLADVPAGGSPTPAASNCRKIMSILVPDAGVAGECTMM